MARAAKKSPPLLTFNHPIKIEVRPSEFKWLDSVRHLDMQALEKAARIEVEIGEVKTECCQHLVRAVIRKGMVTGLRVEAMEKTSGSPITPELKRLLMVVRRKLLARHKSGPRLPMPVKTFLKSDVTLISVTTITCIQICFLGWCIACCFSDTNIFCGKVTIDTTNLPYPE